MPIGNAATVTYFPQYSTPFGVVATSNILAQLLRKCLA